MLTHCLSRMTFCRERQRPWNIFLGLSSGALLFDSHNFCYFSGHMFSDQQLHITFNFTPGLLYFGQLALPTVLCLHERYIYSGEKKA